MLKLFIGFAAAISALFTGDRQNANRPPLNTAIIAYSQTYFAPAVADLGNFPRAGKSTPSNSGTTEKKSQPAVYPPPAKAAVSPATPAPAQIAPIPEPAPATPPAAPQDPYLAIPEPVITWLNMDLTLKGTGMDGNRTLPELSFDREYWRIEAFAYWAPQVSNPRPDLQNDYFKIEVYEKGSDKLIYTMTSGSNESFHQFQSFRKPGTYYFKVYAANPSSWELHFSVSPKLAQ